MRFSICLVSVAMVAGCEGPAGPTGGTGTNALVSTADEPPGANCEFGGTKITVGADSNDDGVLQDSEVTRTTYVCDAQGTNGLVKTTAEAAGTNCPFGGTKVESGLDANNNGTLDASEVDTAATSYVCVLGPAGALSPSTGLVALIKNVSTSSTAPITVRFTLKDDRNYPVDLNGMYSVNTPIQPRFTLARFTKDARDQITPYTVYTKSGSNPMPTMYNPLGGSGQGTIAENGFGAGDYTYTFPTTTTTNGAVAVAYDTNAMDQTHVVWIQASRQTDLVYQLNANTYFAANVPYNYVPSGNGTPLERELVRHEACDNCHNKFKAETVTSAQFHGGGRVDARMCNVCHNPGRTSNPEANSASFVHRIHNSEDVATASLFHGVDITYPQDTRNCATCHANAKQGAQAHTNPSVLACRGCHSYVQFDGSAADTCGVTAGPGTGPTRGSDGKPVPCNHFAGTSTGPAADCASCHGPGGAFPDTKFHVAVAEPDPANSWLGGANANTNASYVAASGVVPTGANVITYDVATVDTVLDTTVTPNVKRPRIKFKLKLDGTDVVFQTYAAGSVTEMIPNFVGSPSAYFAFAMPQDNNPTPADFNASVSGYIKSIWNGTATGTGVGTLTGPDGSGYYTLTLTKVQIPAAATMLTGGIGYTYSLSSTPPLVQTNVTGYPWTPQTSPYDGRAQGGLSVPAPNVWKVATGYTGRRAIVETAKCNNCHGAIGVKPTFHAGQRNDGPTCSFCHNPNRTSSGWAASSKYFIHAIHAGRKRVVNFTWHAAAKGPGYDEVEFPGTLNLCTNCHTPNTYDFTNATNLASVPNQNLTTVATGKYDTNPLVNSTYYTISPYVTADGVYDYGAGFAFNASTGLATDAAPTTLVLSQVTGACSACHDTPAAINHMKLNGGLFYAPRATATAPNAPPEQCLICHGPGRTAAIGVVHQR